MTTKEMIHSAPNLEALHAACEEHYAKKEYSKKGPERIHLIDFPEWYDLGFRSEREMAVFLSEHVAVISFPNGTSELVTETKDSLRNICSGGVS